MGWCTRGARPGPGEQSRAAAPPCPPRAPRASHRRRAPTPPSPLFSLSTPPTSAEDPLCPCSRPPLAVTYVRWSPRAAWPEASGKEARGSGHTAPRLARAVSVAGAGLLPRWSSLTFYTGCRSSLFRLCVCACPDHAALSTGRRCASLFFASSTSPHTPSLSRRAASDVSLGGKGGGGGGGGGGGRGWQPGKPAGGGRCSSHQKRRSPGGGGSCGEIRSRPTTPYPSLPSPDAVHRTVALEFEGCMDIPAFTFGTPLPTLSRSASVPPSRSIFYSQASYTPLLPPLILPHQGHHHPVQSPSPIRSTPSPSVRSTR